MPKIRDRAPLNIEIWRLEKATQRLLFLATTFNFFFVNTDFSDRMLNREFSYSLDLKCVEKVTKVVKIL